MQKPGKTAIGTAQENVLNDEIRVVDIKECNKLTGNFA